MRWWQKRSILGPEAGGHSPISVLRPFTVFLFFCGVLLVCLYLSSISLFLRIPFSFAFSAVFSIVRLAFVIKDDPSGFLVTGLCF